MDNGKPATAHIFTVPIENIGLFFLQTLGVYPFTFGGHPRHLIARCCTIGGVLHLQLHLLFNRDFFLLQLFDLIRKLLPLIQQVADGIQIGSFVSIICRVQLIDLLCIPLASGRYRRNFGHHVVFPEVLFLGNEVVQNFFVGCDLVNHQFFPENQSSNVPAVKTADSQIVIDLSHVMCRDFPIRPLVRRERRNRLALQSWDSPHTTVLFMARPTMSKTIYLQQLGRGTRRCPGKEDLLVVDFVDNANMFNMPYSLHRVLDIAKYQPMAYVLAPENKRKLDQDMLFQGEKPEAWLDVPIDVSDYEIIDLFNWQNSVKDMISQIEFVRMVDVQSETVERYIKDGKVKPDLSIPFGDKRMFHYFREESIRNIAKQYGWDLITPQNMADKFMKFIETMDMSYSYKPVLLKAIYEYMDTSGRVALPDVVDYFIDFYEDRRAHGMIAEKSTSIYQKGGYTRKDVEKNILSNPFKRFEDMRFLMRCKDVETIEVNPIIFRKLTREDWLHIVNACDKSLEKYYLRLKK